MHNLVDRHDLWLLSRAASFTAVQFMGAGQYDTRTARSLSNARAAARAMLGDGTNNRPIAIYGVTADGKSVFIENMDRKSELITEGANMSIYVLSYRAPNINQIEVFRMPNGADKVRAAAFVGTLPEDYGALIVETIDDTRKLSGTMMVKLYNELLKQSNKKLDLHGSEARTSITKFENLAIGANRLFKELTDAATDVPEDKLTVAEAVANSPTVKEPETDPLTTAIDTAMAAQRIPLATKIPNPDGTSRSKMDLTKKIELIVAGNPKVKTSKTFARFALYQTGDTVQQFLDKGGTIADVRWDVKMNFIKLID